MMTPDEILRQADQQIAANKASGQSTASGDSKNGSWRDHKNLVEDGRVIAGTHGASSLLRMFCLMSAETLEYLIGFCRNELEQQDPARV